MKNKITLWILLAVMVLVGVVFVYRLTVPLKPGQVVKSILPSLKKAKPSPYSLGWGSELLRVVDQDGEGVAGATVSFTKYLRRDCNGNITEEPPEWQDTAVTTNEKGEFSCPPEIWQAKEGKKKPTIHAKIEAAGFLPRSDVGLGVNYADDSGEIDIFRIGRIEGAIIDPNGQPIANVPIWLNPRTHYKNPGVFCNGCYSATAKTDESGGFVFEKVPPGLHVVKFPGHAGGCGPEPKIEKIPFKEYATFQMIDMKDGAVKDDVFLDLRQSRGTITGKVVDKYNRPMAGARAILSKFYKRYYEGGSSSTSENIKAVSADENGNYVLDHIPSGDYQLRAQYAYEKGKNYKSGDPLNIYLAGKQEVVFNLVLERQDDSLPKPDHREKSLFAVPLPKDLGPNDMMVVDPRGNGITGASVVFDKTITIENPKTGKKTRKEWDGVSLTTDSQGVFVLPEIFQEIKGKWECYASIKADGYYQRRAWLRSYYQKRDCRVDILPLSEIQGQLIGWDGKPVKGAVALLDEMTAYRNPGSGSSGGGYGDKATDKEGCFKLIQVPEGTHIFQYKVLNPEKKQEHTGSFVIYTQDGKDVDDLMIDLRKDTCVARGRVLDWDGKPIKKATVRLSKSVRWGYDGYCTMWPEFYRSEATNRKGQYSIENIHPGVYEIEAVLEGKKRRTSDKMSIAVAEGQVIELDVRLKR